MNKSELEQQTMSTLCEVIQRHTRVALKNRNCLEMRR